MDCSGKRLVALQLLSEGGSAATAFERRKPFFVPRLHPKGGAPLRFAPQSMTGSKLRGRHLFAPTSWSAVALHRFGAHPYVEPRCNHDA